LHSSRNDRPAETERVKVKKEVDEDEKAKRLREMMENAAWRDDQRSKKLQAYRDREQEEEEERRYGTNVSLFYLILRVVKDCWLKDFDVLFFSLPS
jgi:hypothetical protein